MSSSILEQIKQYKLEEIDALKKNNGLELLEKNALAAMPPRDFYHKLAKIKIPKVNIIAEIKKASPSKGIINKNFDPAVLAQTYQESGASCISVLTDFPSFKGKPEDLKIAKENSDIPILRKDFIFDEIQVFESRSMGADCILIIMAALSNSEAKRIETLALDLKMNVILEVHNKKELDRALDLKSRLIGINNRDLNTFETDLETTINLNKFIPEGYHVISESGLSNRNDIKKMCEHGINTFLIGETLMKSSNIKDEFKRLLG